eukprot:g39742.t1
MPTAHSGENVTAMFLQLAEEEMRQESGTQSTSSTRHLLIFQQENTHENISPVDPVFPPTAKTATTPPTANADATPPTTNADVAPPTADVTPPIASTASSSREDSSTQPCRVFTIPPDLLLTEDE